MKASIHSLLFLLFATLAVPQADAQTLRDDFNRAATTDLAGSLKWRRVLDLTDTAASIQINGDSTISPYNPGGLYSRGAVYWDSALTPPFEVGIVLKHKSGSTGIPSFYLQVMDDSSWYTGDGYGFRFQENSGQDRMDIQRVGGSGVDTPNVALMANLNREFLEGDTLFFRFYADGRKTGVYHSAGGMRDSISTTNTTFNPSAWYVWLQGAVFTDPIRMDDFMVGPIPYTITATAGTGGSITPAGILPVNPGEDRAFVITPDAGYYISDVHVDTVSVGAVSSYTFTSVDSNHSIEAFFDTLGVITATAGPNGTISPSGDVTVGYGADQGFTVTPDAGYHTDSILVDGARVDSLSGYTFTNVVSGHTIEAFFSINTYTITATAGANGTISPSGGVPVAHGANQGFIVTPGAGYHTDSIRVDGVRVDSLAGYTFVNVTGPHTIEAFFSKNTYAITAAVLGNGTITPSGVVYVDHDSSRSFAITPNAGYHVDSVVVDGVKTDSTASYTFTGVTAPHTITAHFSINVYTIAATAGPNGAISPSGPVSVNHGSSRNFTITPATGYHVDSVVVDGIRTDSTTSYTFTNVTSNHSILAFFSVNVYTITATAAPNGSIAPAGSVSITHGASRAYTIAPNTGYHIDSVVVDGLKTDSTVSYTFTSVTADHTIEAYFSINTYTIAATAGPNGSIIPSGPVTVSHGGSLGFTVVPDPGYHVDSVVVDGVKTDSLTGYTFTNVTDDHSIVSFFSINTYTITATAGAGGTITPSGGVVVNHGASQAFAVTPATGYHVDSIRVDGVKVDSLGGYTFTNVTANHTIDASFSINIYTIASSAGPNGTITPSGLAGVPHGGTRAFTVSPNTGYHTDSIVVDGVRVDSLTGYTFTNVTADHTIQAHFSINTYTITATAGAGGTITPSGAVSVNHGDSQAFTVSPNTGYHVDSVLVDGVRTDSTGGNTFANVTADHTIEAFFSVNTYTITATAGANGTITPSGAVSVNHGDTQAFAVTPATGYHVDSVLVDAVKVDSLDSYTFTNVTAGHTIEAFFSIDVYTITATAGANGTITPPGAVSVNHGDTQAFTISPNAGYHVDSVLVDAVKVDSLDSYTFTNVTAGHTIEAFFSIDVYTITATAGANGTITPSGAVSVNHGDSQAFTVSPNTGYHVDSVLVDGVMVDSLDSYTFAGITTGHTIEAFFSINAFTITATTAGNGTIAPSGTVGVTYGGSRAFTVTPQTGHHIDSVVVDGLKTDSTVSYTFTNVTADHTIQAYFSVDTYTITATAGANGSISPSGLIAANYGDTRAFTVTPQAGYHVDSVLVDGVKTDSTTGYTFTGVDADHTIDAFFSINTYEITATAGPNGSITPSGTLVLDFGSDRTFFIAADEGYHVDSVLVDGSSVGTPGSYDFTNVDADHTIEAFFSINRYEITASAGPGGSISPSGTVGIDHGGTQAFVFLPAAGYHVDSAVVDGNRVDSLTGYTFTNVTAAHSIEVFFAINVYTITATAGANGTITPSGGVAVSHGASQAFTITPQTGYHVDSVLVDGVRVDSMTGYTFVNVVSDRTIGAFFSVNAYTITATAGPNGTITPSGAIGLNYGASQAFMVSPNTGYHVDSILVDGLRVDSLTGYTFTNVTASHSIAAFFSINTYTVTATAGPNGTITPAGVTAVEHGDSLAFTVTPNAGYHVDSILVDGVSVGSASGYTFRNIAGNHLIDAYFSINVYIVTATATPGGSITPAGPVAVNHGANRSFVLAPDPNHHLDSLLVDGLRSDSVTGYTFVNVTSAHTIQAFFSIDAYTITATAGPNGTITPSGSVGVTHGSSRTFTVTPNTGYHIDSVRVDGVKVDSTSSYTFTNITTSHTIQAFFSINIYRIIATAGTHGSISPAGEIFLPHGSSQAFTITPDPGYHVDSIVVNGVRTDSTASYTIAGLASDYTVFAYFSINTYTITATASPNGTITPSGAVTVSHNATRGFLIAPNTGYHLDSVLVDGVKVDSTTSYTFRFVTANHTIAAYFSVNTYTINALVSGGGTITPSGPVSVNYGASRAFAITPDSSHLLDSVLVDGVKVDSTTSYTFTNVTANHTIRVVFRIKTFSITATAAANGIVTPSGTSIVNHGDSLRVTITPDLGYYVADVLVDNVSQGAIASYTFRNVTTSHLLQAFFSTNAPPSAPRLASPVNGDTIPSYLLGAVRFSWKASTDTDPGDVLTYSIRLFGSGVNYTTGGISDTAAVLDLRGVLLAGNEYRWSVTVDDGSASVASPDTFSFRVNFATAVDGAGVIPESYALGQNYPNPFNPSTTIRFDIPERSAVTLRVYNILGVEVKELLGGETVEAGVYRVAADYSDLSSGTYFYRLSARGVSGVEFTRVGKMVLLR